MEKNYDALFNEAFDNKKDLTAFANEFSEGDDLLKNTLINLWKHNIRTLSCCKGHDNEKYYIPSYISIVMDDNNIALINLLISKVYSQNQDVSMHFTNKNNNIFSIYMRGNSKPIVLNFINQYLGVKVDENLHIIENILLMFDYAKRNALFCEVELAKGNVYVTLKKPNADISYIEFKTLAESISALKDLENISHVFIKGDDSDLDKIIMFLKQNTTRLI